VTVRRDSTTIAERNVAAQLSARGVGRARLAMVWKMPEPDYIPYRALADLMVDNVRYNGHTTGADTLWAGVPAVALNGRHLAGRAAASFLGSLGLSLMVAPSWRAYEDAIAGLGANHHRLWRLRRMLLERREAAPFFDLARLARSQERVAYGMYHVVAAGRRPMHVLAARSP
jgi:predicted O-linked N-acetylglucosamine transferase (SPINDLY family)